MKKMRKMKKIARVDDFAKLGFGKKMNFLPPWIIRIKWNNPSRAQLEGWPLFWGPVSAFMLSTGYRFIYFNAKDSQTGEVLTRMYTLDKMDANKCKKFDTIIQALEHAGITPVISSKVTA